jgi:catechol 2,3-dioxygenase-like lactoylglutathione lyase family enzyme
MALTFLSPILWTKDLSKTIAFYENVLGFTSQSNFPNFVTLISDEVQIMFIVPVEEPEDCKEPGNNEPFFSKPAMTGDLYIFTDDVNSLYERVKGKARVKMDIGDREYGMRDFSVWDNNGYELCFGQSISQQP